MHLNYSFSTLTNFEQIIKMKKYTTYVETGNALPFIFEIKNLILSKIELRIKSELIQSIAGRHLFFLFLIMKIYKRNKNKDQYIIISIQSLLHIQEIMLLITFIALYD
jgi:hypothetical protein